MFRRYGDNDQAIHQSDESSDDALGCIFGSSDSSCAGGISHASLGKSLGSRKVLSTHADLRFHLSNANFDSQGVVYAPAGTPSYARLDTDVLARWAVSPTVTVFGRLNWESLFLTLNSLPASAFGFGDQTLGATFRALSQERFKVDIQIQADVPLYDNNKSATAGTPFFGNSVVDFTGGVFGRFAPSANSTDFLVHAGAGYTWRSNGYSPGMPWRVGISYRPQTRSLGFELFWMSYLSLTPVSFPALNVTPCNTTLPNVGTGGLCWAGSPSPSFGRIHGQVNFRVSPLLLARVTGSYVIYGSSAPNDLQMGLGMTFALGARNTVEDPDVESALSRSRERERFSAPQSPAVEGVMTYSLEGKVIRSNDRMHLVQINLGSERGVRVGDTIDIFSITRNGQPRETIARGRVISVKLNEAAVKIGEYFKEVWIEQGFIVKKPMSGGTQP